MGDTKPGKTYNSCYGGFSFKCGDHECQWSKKDEVSSYPQCMDRNNDIHVKVKMRCSECKLKAECGKENV